MNYSNEPEYKEIGSPYRQALYRTARSMGMSPEKAKEAAKSCDQKVVRKFERG